jgi:hypothetical protein
MFPRKGACLVEPQDDIVGELLFHAQCGDISIATASMVFDFANNILMGFYQSEQFLLTANIDT